MPADSLIRLQQAHKVTQRARYEERALLVEAREAGCSYADLARVLGVSRQAVRQLLGRVNEASDESAVWLIDPTPLDRYAVAGLKTKPPS